MKFSRCLLESKILPNAFDSDHPLINSTLMHIILFTLCLQEWIGCRLNVKPLEKLDGWLQVMCYPKRYDEFSPYFLFELGIKDLKCGPLASRSQPYVYGLFWNVGIKRCKLFFSFLDKSSYDAYIMYLKNVLRALETCVNRKCLHIGVPDEI